MTTVMIMISKPMNLQDATQPEAKRLRLFLMFRVCFGILSTFQRVKFVAFMALDSRKFGKIARAGVCVLCLGPALCCILEPKWLRLGSAPPRGLGSV